MGALAVTLAASELMVRGLTRLGSKLRLSEGLVGLLTALGADAPELSSAVIAILAGSRAVGLGVVLGSNLFNLAALLGLAALVGGGLAMRRDALLVDGAVGLAAVLLAGLLVAGWAPAALVAGLMLILFVGYALALGLRLAPGHREHEPQHAEEGSWTPALLLPVAVALVIAGAFGLVYSALELSAAWHVPPAFVGGIVLAVLTSLPNAYAAVHLGRQGRGTAVMSEAMNSNTLNLLGGLALPAAIFGLGSLGPTTGVTYLWLAGLTVLALALCASGGRMRRREAALVIAGYLGFVVYLVVS